MNPKIWKKVKELFEKSVDLREEERSAFLDQVCGEDTELRVEVEKLLRAHDQNDSFLESPAAAEAPTVFHDTGEEIQQTTGALDKGAFVAGTILDDRYRIISLLGKGGMGEVYKAEDLKLSQLVALKFLPEALERNQDALARFVSEVRIARQVSHPNVCKVYDIGDVDGKHFLSMEFIEGDDLSLLLNRIGRLPSDKAAEISRQICFGLHAIHDAGILHRDLKPANVIIDSKGKARITDFGIAGIEEEIRREELSVGTPAYMSPEQFNGKDVTTKSDIYSIGLLLYEIYTGKQVFKADSIPELIKKHQTTEPTNPSEFVENIDPIVEKTIKRCLEKDPNKRPSSALQVALALPGGNPLEAAIAAGETPSPEMVAASPLKGALTPGLAAVLVVSILVSFAFFVYQQQEAKVFNFSSETKPRDVLVDRSREILSTLGYPDEGKVSVNGFEEDPRYYAYATELVLKGKKSHSEVRSESRTGFAPYVDFFYRQSKNHMVASSDVMVTTSDPPMVEPEMVLVKLDLQGRLRNFVAVPPGESSSSEPVLTDWGDFFKFAGIEKSNFREVQPKFNPPVYADSRRSWVGSINGFRNLQFSIDAASVVGKPVYFKLRSPWEERDIDFAAADNPYRQLGMVAIFLMYVSVVVGSLLLARRNVKAGRADMRGALRLSGVLFVLYLLQKLLIATHVPSLWPELSILYNAVARALLISFFTGAIYLALEPYIRRHWSSLLVAWSRLLSGDFRDPLIGRDILFGFLLGTGHTLGIFLGSLGYSFSSGNSGVLSNVFVFEAIYGVEGAFSSLLGISANSVTNGFLVTFVLLGLFLLQRRKNVSVLLLFCIAFSIQSLIFVLTQDWAYLISSLINVACMCFAVYRFGLLGIMAFWAGFYFTYLTPLTLDTSSPYFFNTVLTSVFVAVLCGYCYYVSTAGRALFADSFADDV